MNIQDVIEKLDQWGRILQSGDDEQEDVIQQAYYNNQWFTPDNTRTALNAITHNFLRKDKLQEWVSEYPDLHLSEHPQKIGLVMAGNIPLVGFHDLLAVLITGNIAMIKMSSKDQYLLPYVLKKLRKISTPLADRIKIVDRLDDIDAVIATGSNNSARYFEYYFGKYPHIIRKNRASAAVLTGNESEQEIEKLGNDIFQYFGLGCRNVSKLYVPQGYDITQLFPQLSNYMEIKDHNKYRNNFDYNCTLLLMNGQPHLANEFLIMEEKEAISSPVATIYYEYYASEEELKQKLEMQKENIQCITSKDGYFEGSVPLGEAQQPQLWDYADNVDTIEFLRKL